MARYTKAQTLRQLHQNQQLFSFYVSDLSRMYIIFPPHSVSSGVSDLFTYHTHHCGFCVCFAVSLCAVTTSAALNASTALSLITGFGSRTALKMRSKNCWTCWKKYVGIETANSRRTSTCKYYNHHIRDKANQNYTTEVSRVSQKVLIIWQPSGFDTVENCG